MAVINTTRPSVESLRLHAGSLSRGTWGYHHLQTQMGLQETGTATWKPIPHPSAGSEAKSSHEKGPRQQGHSYLSLVFPFLQLSLLVHHHSCDRHVGVLLSGLPDGLGQRLPGQERALSVQEWAPSQDAKPKCTRHLGLHVEPWWFYSFLWGSRKIWMGSPFTAENASHFPKVPTSPVCF